MKFLINILIFWISFFKAEEENCGYYGTRGNKIEKELDECYAKNVIDNRVRMSVGFEICFGYNYQKLNDTIAEPLLHHKNIAIDEIHILQNESCRIENQKKRPSTDTGDIDYAQESQNLKECKRYFQNIINAFNDDQDTLQTYLNANDELIQDFFENQKAILELKNQIVQKLQKIKDCKEPENVMKEKLIKKYLQSFLNDLASPSSQAFSKETYDVLRNPDKYATYESKNTKIPTFKNYDVNNQSLLRNNELKKRKIELKSRENQLQRLITNSARLDDKSFKEEFEKWGLQQSDDPNDQVQVKMEVPDKQIPFSEIPFQKKTNPNLNDETHKEVIAINNFWNKDIKIKNKRINDEDFDRYKIKGWDINKKIKKLFKINV